MYFYDQDKKIVKIPITEKISHRFNTHYIYKTVNGKCLKRFRVVKEPDLQTERKIQSLQLDNIYRIDQYLFNATGDFRGIIMPYYDASSEDILLKPSDYLADNFSTIFSSFKRLSDEGIIAADANLENTIFTNDEIIIIDTERYYEDKTQNIEDIKQNNYVSAAWILYFSLIKAAKKHQQLQDIPFYEWFYSTRPDGITLCRELTHYQYPIEYLQKVKKKIK